MTGIIITSENKSDLKLFFEMAKRIGVSATTLNDEDLLDIGLLNAMQKGKKTDFVPREKIMKTLGKK